MDLKSNAIRTLSERNTEIVSRLGAIDEEAGGSMLSEERANEWKELTAEREANEKTVAELEARATRLAELAGRDEVSEDGQDRFSFSTSARTKKLPNDLSDLQSYRQMSRDIDQLHDNYLEGALRLNEELSWSDAADAEKTQKRVEKLLRSIDDPSEDRPLARRLISTSGTTYQRAWSKYIAGKTLNREEQDSLSRAASLTTTAGGFAVPVTLDPTVIITNAGAINPVRQIARVITITGNTWKGVSSAGITASFDAEAAEVSDDAPTIAQPAAIVEMARAFVPMSIEVSEDWQSIQSEMSNMFADAKDILESSKYLTGLGNGSTQPEGLLVGATGTRVTATASAFAVADLYSVINDLSPRWRRRASFTGGLSAYQKIRQFDTGGGASLWTQLQFGNPADLVGYPAYEWSDYSSALTTPGSSVLTFGDFNQFAIVDRVGMSVEVIPHLFHTSNNLPSGQRGLFAYWRTTSDVVTASAFKTVKIS